MSGQSRMPLGTLLPNLSVATALADIELSGLALDSRLLRPGEVFVALAGEHAHGIDHAVEAAARGAALVLAEGPARAVPAAAASLPVIWIENLHERLGPLAARFYGDPSAALKVVGVTGTNGKTSTVQLLDQALSHAGFSSASIGTLGSGLHAALRAGARTTPDAISVQRLLAEFRSAKASHVAMEVSSHALVQGRVSGVHFALAVFTNLSRDHLDYHRSMEAYGAAKARLFTWPGLGAAVINTDDAFGRELAAQVAARAEVELIRYSYDARPAEVRASMIEPTAAGLRFLLHTPWGEGVIESGLLGRFNVSNLLAVAACLGRLGLAWPTLTAALAALEPVPGRMNRLGGGSRPLVVVDYAHTPAALEQALRAARAHCAGRLVCVFGCGGERDRGKRPQMGAIAEELADRLLISDDNPRGEDGDAIVAEIRAGLARPAQALVERDRAAAISLAIGQARPGDVVLIAGKGHETEQEVGGYRQPFDDRAVAARVLELIR